MITIVSGRSVNHAGRLAGPPEAVLAAVVQAEHRLVSPLHSLVQPCGGGRGLLEFVEAKA